MKPKTFIYRKKWIHYQVINNVIWIDVLSVIKALNLYEIAELKYLASHPNLNLAGKEINFNFSDKFQESILCLNELQVYQWLLHIEGNGKSTYERNVFCSNLYDELRKKVKFDFIEVSEYELEYKPS